MFNRKDDVGNEKPAVTPLNEIDMRVLAEARRIVEERKAQEAALLQHAAMEAEFTKREGQSNLLTAAALNAIQIAMSIGGISEWTDYHSSALRLIDTTLARCAVKSDRDIVPSGFGAEFRQLSAGGAIDAAMRALVSGSAPAGEATAANAVQEPAGAPQEPETDAAATDVAA